MSVFHTRLDLYQVIVSKSSSTTGMSFMGVSADAIVADATWDGLCPTALDVAQPNLTQRAS